MTDKEELRRLAQANKQQGCSYDHDLHTAWCSVAMGLATDYAEAYCNHQCDDTQDMLGDLLRTRRALMQHLLNQPASMGQGPDVAADENARLRAVFDAARAVLRYDGADGRRSFEAMRALDAAVQAVLVKDQGDE